VSVTNSRRHRTTSSVYSDAPRCDDRGANGAQCAGADASSNGVVYLCLRDRGLVATSVWVEVLARHQGSVLPPSRADAPILVVKGPLYFDAFLEESQELVAIGVYVLSSVLKFAIGPISFVDISVREALHSKTMLLALFPIAAIAFSRGSISPFPMPVVVSILPLAAVCRAIWVGANSLTTRHRIFAMRVAEEGSVVAHGLPQRRCALEGAAQEGLREHLVVNCLEDPPTLGEVAGDELEVLDGFGKF